MNGVAHLEVRVHALFSFLALANISRKCGCQGQPGPRADRAFGCAEFSRY